METSSFVPIYEEISKIVGEEKTIQIYENFKGQQITFPKRLYNVSYVSKYAKTHFNGKNLRELARKFDYSDRQMRELMKRREE